MASSKIRDAWLPKDWWPLTLLIGVAWAWQVILLALSGRMAPGLIAFCAWLPLLLSLPWAIWASVRLLQRTTARTDEFKGKARDSFRRISVNLGVVLIQVLTFSLLVSIGAFWVFMFTLGIAGLVEILPIPSVEWIGGFLARFYVLGLVLTLLVAAITHLAYLFGRLVERYQWLLSLWVYVIVSWIGLRLIPVFGDWLSWLPPFSFEELYVVGGAYEFRTFFVESGPLGGLVLFGALVVLGASFVLSGVSPDEVAGVKSPSEGGVS